MNWVIGDKAYQRWLNRHKHSFKYFIRCSIKKVIDIKRKRETRLNKIVLQLNNAEEEIKSKFKDSIKGFLMCVRDTTMYNHKSTICVTCKNMIKCKGVLKQEFPKVYKLRGYGER